MEISLPDFGFEKSIWKKGFYVIGGVDEVGRGCLAGPVTAGCVVFPKGFKVSELAVTINDSKKLRPREREKADKWIRDKALAWGIGEAPVSVINKAGIVKATQMAFRRAIIAAGKNSEKSVDFLLIDAFYAPYVKGLRRKNQKAIIKGDTRSVSIAAASIIAKVYRDRQMTKLSKLPKYKAFGWGRNKGYGTAEHKRAISKHGITRLHRKLFVRNLIEVKD